MIMLQIAICDDEISELEYTFEMLEDYRACHPELQISVRKFQNGSDLLETIDGKGRFDIYLLDILMPDINGIEIGSAIRRKDSATVLIYLTSSPDFAIESYQVEAQGYLLKPFEKKALFAALDKAAAYLDAEDTKRLVIQRPGGGANAIPYCKVLYVEYYQHRLIIHHTDGSKLESIFYREPFDRLVGPLLSDSRFVKISASHIVNMQHVCGVTSRQFELINGERLTLSRTYIGARQAYIEYLLERGIEK